MHSLSHHALKKTLACAFLGLGASLTCFAWDTSAQTRADVGTPPYIVQNFERGERFPDILFYAPNGEPRRLSDYNGMTRVILFMASWCPHCNARLPDLKILYEKIRSQAPENIRIMVFNIKEPHETFQNWLNKKGSGIYAYRTEESTRSVLPTASGGSYFVYAVPEMLTLRPDGTVENHFRGVERLPFFGWLKNIHEKYR